MEQTSPVIFSDTKANNFFRKRHTNTISFAVGILLFLLPFAEVKCGSVTLVGNTGIGLVMGTPWKTAMGLGDNEYFNKLKGPSEKTTREMLTAGPNVFAILALVFAAAGVAVCFSNHRTRSMAGMSTGILAALMLIALLIQYKLAMNSALSSSEDTKDIDMSKLVKLKFTTWYYLSLASFAAAAFFSYWHSRIELEDAMEKAVDFEFQEQKV